MDEDSAGAGASESHAGAEEEAASDVAIVWEIAPGSGGAGRARGEGGALGEVDYKTGYKVSVGL